MTLNVQFMTMIFMVSGGFYLGTALDTFRRFSPYWKGNTFLKYFLEICFWLTQTLVLFYLLFRVNAGELRLYIFLACLLGFATYQAVAASLYKRFLEQVIRVITAIYRFFAKLIQVLVIAPITFIIQSLIVTILFIARVLLSIVQFIGKIIFTPIKWFFQLGYWLLPKSFQKFLHKFAGFYSIMKNIGSKWLKRIMSKWR